VTNCHKASQSLALVVVVAIATGCGRERPAEHVTLPREPFLGLACRDAAADPCARLGLAVWLRRSARAVTATVDAHSVTLATGRGTGPYRRGAFWQGFFDDRRAERYCDDSPQRVSVDVRVLRSDETEGLVQASPIVSCGYG
jgi:hypothetical protein